MIIIIQKTDTTSDQVIEWLLNKSIPVQRLNGFNKNNKFQLKLSNNENRLVLNSKKINRVWHRRSSLNLLNPTINN